MGQATANEQYLLELVNAARKAAGKQPLALNSYTNTAADLHTDYMIDTNLLTHTGSGGTSAYTRMKNAGYDFNGSSTWGENVAWRSVAGTASYQDEIKIIHDWLMNSSGHRANILNGSFREIGIGIDVGPFQGFNSVVATEDFATSTGRVFLTGVSFADKDGDRSYDIGEGLGGFTVTAKNSSTGAVYSTTGSTAGGYALALPAGTYSYTFSANGYAAKTGSVTIGSTNVKVDWIDPATSSQPITDSSSSSSIIKGTSSSETLTGTSGNDTLYGYAGSDTLKGGAGADTMIGGTGNDTYYVDHAGDKITEKTSEGTDTIKSSVTYTIPSFVEHMELTGTANINGTGTGYHNDIHGNAGNNVLKGLDGNDRLYGGAGNDRLEGGNGDDFLQGGTGTDTLIGGAGRDTFDWNSVLDIGKGSTRDVVLDFAQGYDKIDLSGIDAKSGTSTNDAFTFIGNQAFHGTAGELRYFHYDGTTDYTVIQGDVNGDKIADFEIKLDGHMYNLQSNDFIL